MLLVSLKELSILFLAYNKLDWKFNYRVRHLTAANSKTKRDRALQVVLMKRAVNLI